jgi:DNA-binding NtrC family response regulator
MSHVPSELLIVDDDADLREALADLLEDTYGRHVLGAAGLDQLAALGQRALECGLVIIDVNLGMEKPSGLEVLAWLREHGYRGKAVFLTGHARTTPQVEQAHHVEEGVAVLSKPLGVDALMALVERTS